MMRAYIFGFLFLLVCGGLRAQAVQANFSIQAQACLNENVQLTNSSINADRYEWDFCQGDLSATPTASVVANLSGNITTGVDVVFDGAKWIGFVTSRDANAILRLDFGADIKSSPTIVNLGNVSNVILKPVDIKIIFENGIWYGFVYGQEDPKLIRIDFGNSLFNTTSSMVPITATVVATGAGSINGGLDIVYDGTKWIIVSTKSPSFEIFKLNTITSIPTASDILTGIANPLGTSLGDVTIYKSNGLFFGYIAAFGTGKLLRLNFGADLFTTPIIQDISSVLPAGSSPYGIDGAVDNGNYYLFIAMLQGNLFKINLGTDLTMPPLVGTDIGQLSILTNTLKLKLVKEKTSWSSFSVDFSSTNLFRVDFPNPAPCPADFSFSFVSQPTIKYITSGTTRISLRSFKGGTYDEAHKSITISSLNAPAINFTNQQVCLQSPIQFTSTSDQTIASQSWDFGDAQTSSAVAPQNVYASVGAYDVSLKVTSSNGCTNTELKTIKIYNQPTPTFTLPTGLVCTNNEFTFTNTTTDNFDGNLSYEWLVNDVSNSTVRDLKHAFTSVGDQQIKLKTSIPGCTTETIQTLLDVKTGPTVAFTVAGKCEDESIIFSNGSTGAISSYLWNFGDGNNDAQQNTAHAFPDPGNYNVSLQTIGTNGCTSTLAKPVNIYSVPQTNFSLELPPFSCAGTPSQFNDLTPPMPDSNVSTWAWVFGDVANGNASQKNPLYTYLSAADYLVSLTTTTNFGCTNSIQKSITISPSPKADFSVEPACVNRGTQFTDLSTGDVKSWLWSVQNKTYTVKNAQHIFNSAATYNAMLTVTSNNNCISQISKNVIVPIAVTADFTAQATCATKPALFLAVNASSADPAVSWSWNFDGQATGAGLSPQHIFPLVGNYSVAMSTTRQSGCIYSVTKTISVIAPPTAGFSVFLEAGAAPFPVDFVNTSSRATSNTWKFGDALNTTSNFFSPSFTYTTLGTYTAELTAGNAIGCTDTYSKLISVVVPTINAAIADFDLKKTSAGWSPVVTIENKSNIALINSDVYLDISGSALLSEKIIAVIKPGAFFTHPFATTISPRAVHYACAEIKINADTFLFDNRQCVNVADQFTSLTPYPNPANAELILEWINQRDEPMQVIIYSSSGQVVLSKEYSTTLQGLNQVNVNVSSLQAGIYFASYSAGGLPQNFRFSIIR